MDHQPTPQVFPLLSLPNVALDRVMAAFCAHCCPLAPCDDEVCQKMAVCEHQCCEHMATQQHVRAYTLRALARTCRSLNWLATPHLYHRPHLSPDNISRFVRTLGEQPNGPKIAGYVKALYQREQVLSYEEVEYEYPAPAHMGNTSTLTVPVRIRIEEILRIPDKPFLEVLVKCSNLTSLIVHISSPDTSPRFTEIQPNTLTKLKELLVSSEHNYNGPCIEQIQPILAAAPNLEVLVGGRTRWSNNRIPDQQVDLSAVVTHNTLREVRITEGVLVVDEIKAMINALPALEVFEYETTTNMEKAGGSYLLTPHMFYNALSETNCTATLRRLKLKLSTYETYDYQPVSLSAFTALEELEMDPTTLFFLEITPEEDSQWVEYLLPPNLVKLVVTEDLILDEDDGEEYKQLYYAWRWSILSMLYEKVGMHIRDKDMFTRLEEVNVVDVSDKLRSNPVCFIGFMDAFLGTEVRLVIG